MKNFTRSEKRKTTKKARETAGTDILVHHMGSSITVLINSITFLEGSGNYTFIYTDAGKKYLVCKTMKLLSENLKQNFIRIHKSFLINSDLIIERIEEDRLLRMACGRKVTVSRRRNKQITKILNHSQLQISA
ncbi:LytTR family DNA-binding domain-containing protein [Dyadobacter sp. CY356]|uniref:LytR/AlgR family response regulator transcription factor n=1 Tax=Dyadobacter sp. CY356 TaxID=2906442 RepID=UPI001F35C46A|nr:LytTR family DNA-binding domain-containing protein [Dyadobacter sp. CY356]MCF0054973.1 LytTR family transcriptional regulator [Dyadobacter sp. CY356]